MLEFLLNNSVLSAIIAFAIVLIPVIIIHELGHFFAAKMVGISVLEFGVGFPPRLIKLFRWGETDFTLNLLPIGGFVRPFGEDLIGPKETDEIEDETDKRKNEEFYSERSELLARGVPPEKIKSVNDIKPLPRIFFMAAGALANFATAIFLFTLIALIGLPTEVGARVQVVDIPATSPLKQAGVENGDAIERINGEYFANIHILLKALEESKSPLVLTMRSAETTKQYDITLAPTNQIVWGQVFITAVAENSPASVAGFEAGDVVIAINGAKLPADEDPIKLLQNASVSFAGKELHLTVLRAKRELQLTLTPRVDPPKGQGRIGLAIAAQWSNETGIRYVNAAPQQELIPLPFSQAVQYGLGQTGSILKLIVSIPGQIISGSISPEEARPVSVIGISQIGSQIFQESIRQGTPVLILNFIAMVSIFLGFTNLLPLPALDGGRILFALIELVRGKPIAPEIESRVHWFGFMLLLGLGLLVIIYDILNPIALP